eukprot:TRINITY_DN4129_c0_g1_i1.p1 TRINITY_DN4129_c0_g1~~TRINITY_DN4129_c0_g1_i1.p1  ORF type:complete len:198 (+),score=70.55 TRINITY_DN4129_c0_g1_i1:10-603(+)
MAAAAGEAAGPAGPSETAEGTRIVPAAAFLTTADIARFMAEAGKPDALLKKMQEQFNDYKQLEVSLARRRQLMESKIPDLTSTLESVKFLKAKAEKGEKMNVHFPLSDAVLGNAEIEGDGKVCLWLGADVMLEYSYDEAIELLTRNLATTHETIKEIDESQDFIKDQLNTIEVNSARIHNYQVDSRKKSQTAAPAVQ